MAYIYIYICDCQAVRGGCRALLGCWVHCTRLYTNPAPLGPGGAVQSGSTVHIDREEAGHARCDVCHRYYNFQPATRARSEPKRERSRLVHAAAPWTHPLHARAKDRIPHHRRAKAMSEVRVVDSDDGTAMLDASARQVDFVPTCACARGHLPKISSMVGSGTERTY